MTAAACKSFGNRAPRGAALATLQGAFPESPSPRALTFATRSPLRRKPPSLRPPQRQPACPWAEELWVSPSAGCSAQPPYSYFVTCAPLERPHPQLRAGSPSGKLCFSLSPFLATKQRFPPSNSSAAQRRSHKPQGSPPTRVQPPDPRWRPRRRRALTDLLRQAQLREAESPSRAPPEGVHGVERTRVRASGAGGSRCGDASGRGEEGRPDLTEAGGRWAMRPPRKLAAVFIRGLKE